MPFDPEDVRKVAVALALEESRARQSFRAITTKNERAKRRRMIPMALNGSVAGVGYLDDWETPDYEREDDYTDDLVQFLRDELTGERGHDDRRVMVIKRTKTFCGYTIFWLMIVWFWS